MGLNFEVTNNNMLLLSIMCSFNINIKTNPCFNSLMKNGTFCGGSLLIAISDDCDGSV